MALPRRKDVTAKAFNNSPELQQFALTDVTPGGALLGSDSFGSVEKVCPHQLKLSCKTCKNLALILHLCTENVRFLVQILDMACMNIAVLSSAKLLQILPFPIHFSSSAWGKIHCAIKTF